MVTKADLAAPAPGVIVDLFQLDLSSVIAGAVYYFCNGLTKHSTPIVFGGYTYFPWPIALTNMSTAIDGPQTRPSFTIGNKDAMVSNLCKLYDDLLGVKVTRLRTMEKYLDGTPTADGSAYKKDAFYINRKVSDTKSAVEFELASPTDLNNVKLPSRVMLAGSCSFEYKDPETCGWDSNAVFFNSQDAPCTAADDNCSKRISGCGNRFGWDKVLPFGGAPGMSRS